MVIYLVGGAVRDFFLRKIFLKNAASQQEFFAEVEKDWVVVGATPEDMLAQAYRPVGKSFPVFLDPINQEEYALARLERKIGKGYTGFECFTSPDVTLEEDLKRRDLTINAMAFPTDEHGEVITTPSALIDPFNGYEHLQQKIFQHISEAFAEDPVRILRVARFAARWPEFRVAQQTNALMQHMVERGEVEALTAERVWQEFHKALQEPAPLRFFEVLAGCGALLILFPEMTDLTAIHNNLLSNDELRVQQRFALLLQGLSDKDIVNFCDRYRVPNDFRELALLVARYYPTYTAALNLDNAENILNLFEKTDAIRRQDRFKSVLPVFERVVAIRTGTSTINTEKLLELLQVVTNVDTQQLVRSGISGPDFSNRLRSLRLQAIEKKLES